MLQLLKDEVCSIQYILHKIINKIIYSLFKTTFYLTTCSMIPTTNEYVHPLIFHIVGNEKVQL